MPSTKPAPNETKKVAIPVNADRSFSLNIANDAKSKSNTTRSITRGHDIEDDIQLAKGVIFIPKMVGEQSCLKTNSHH